MLDLLENPETEPAFLGFPDRCSEAKDSEGKEIREQVSQRQEGILNTGNSQHRQIQGTPYSDTSRALSEDGADKMFLKVSVRASQLSSLDGQNRNRQSLAFS